MTLAASIKQRRPYRVPAGLPVPRESWRVGTLVSLLLHVGILLLIITPFAMTDEIRRFPEGAGGPGPAGGGGGGNRGTGGVPERVEFVRAVPAATPAPRPPETPTPVPRPVIVEPPKPVVQQLPEAPVPAPLATTAVATIGTGGTGSDNTGGLGPGSGGGVGTGVGTGRGSGVGPGTGGGEGQNYSPTPYEIPLPPMPVPNSLKGDSVIAEFEVDETGRVLSTKFTETGDRGYNRKLAELLRNFKFRPGTTPDGRPIRMKTQIVLFF